MLFNNPTLNNYFLSRARQRHSPRRHDFWAQVPWLTGMPIYQKYHNWLDTGQWGNGNTPNPVNPPVTNEDNPVIPAQVNTTKPSTHPLYRQNVEAAYPKLFSNSLNYRQWRN